MASEADLGSCLARELRLTFTASGLLSIPVTSAVLFLKGHTGLQTPPYSRDSFRGTMYWIMHNLHYPILYHEDLSSNPQLDNWLMPFLIMPLAPGLLNRIGP